jgi:hypothetical protein
LPHSDIPGSTSARPSPELFAACHVLHRLSVPRHPPDALLARACPRPAPSARRSRAQRTDVRGRMSEKQALRPRGQRLPFLISDLRSLIPELHVCMRSPPRKGPKAPSRRRYSHTHAPGPARRIRPDLHHTVTTSCTMSKAQMSEVGCQTAQPCGSCRRRLASRQPRLLLRRHSVADRRCQMSKGALTPPDQLPRRPMPDAGVF